jgi:hypothetical protein
MKHSVALQDPARPTNDEAAFLLTRSGLGRGRLQVDAQTSMRGRLSPIVREGAVARPQERSPPH